MNASPSRYLPFAHACAALALLLACCPLPASGATVRFAHGSVPETLDPARAHDLWTQQQAGVLYDQLYAYDYTARPVRIVPFAAARLPEWSADRRTMTVTLRRGILFSPHPAFGASPRELVADDVVYSIKRVFDPALHSPAATIFAGWLEGMDAAVAAARDARKPFDDGSPIAGIVAVDRYTVRFRLTRPDETFAFVLASPLLSIVAREVVAAEGERFGSSPNGSGPYVVRLFQPGTRLVLERNPRFRALRVGDLSSDAGSAAGRTWPVPDRVELVAIPEASSALLALARGEVDVVAGIAGLRELVLERDRVKPDLAARGVALVRGPVAAPSFIVFNMRDREIGGTAPARIALRRAIAMAFDDDEYVRVLLSGSGHAMQHPIPPEIEGYDPRYRRPYGFDLETANALLDRFGYAKDAAGRRRRPDGSAMTITAIPGTDSGARREAEFLKRSLDRIGVNVAFEALPSAERAKRQGHCSFQIGWNSWVFDWPDGSNLMLAFHGASAGTATLACLQDAEYDRAFETLIATPRAARGPVYRRLVERLDALTAFRLLPDYDSLFLVRTGVSGISPHPAVFAHFPYAIVAPASR